MGPKKSDLRITDNDDSSLELGTFSDKSIYSLVGAISFHGRYNLYMANRRLVVKLVMGKMLVVMGKITVMVIESYSKLFCHIMGILWSLPSKSVGNTFGSFSQSG